MGGLLVPVVDGIAYGLLLFVAAAGLTLCFGAGGVLNLAHGTLVAAGAYTAAALGEGTWTGLAAALAAGALLGAAGGGALAAALAPLGGRGHLDQALATFGLALIGGQVLVLAFGPGELPVALPPALDGTVHLVGHRYPTYRLALVGLALLLAFAGWVVLARTRAGALIRASADDPGMVACLGINPAVVRAGLLVTAGALAGLAGAAGAPVLRPGPGLASSVLLASLVIVVLGGLGSVPGALVAALAVGQVQTLGAAVVPGWAPYLLFAAMAAALLVRRGAVLPAGGAV